MIHKNTDNRDKWIARILCFVVACCLWLYVMSDQNPVVEKEFQVPLSQRNLTEGMITFNVPDKVIVRVRGTRTALAEMPQSDIFAFVNLSKLSVGPHTVPINARFARGDVVQVSPTVVNLLIDVKRSKILPVVAEVVGSPNRDFIVDEQMLIPSEVKVEGAAKRIEAMEKIVVPIDIAGRSEDFTVRQKPLAMGKDGMDMQDIVIDPAEILVRTKMKQKIQTVEVPVKVSYKGKLPEGLKITSATANPFKVNVSGTPSATDGLKELELEPVDLSTVTKDVSIPVAIKLPKDVSPSIKTVNIDITVDKTAEEN